MKYAPTKRHKKMQQEIEKDRKHHALLRWYFHQLTGFPAIRLHITARTRSSFWTWMKQFTRA